MDAPLSAPLSGLRLRDLLRLDDIQDHWNVCDVLILPNQFSKVFLTGFAASDRCLERVYRLRYEIFNLELGEGTAAAAATGLDHDEFDDQMMHLLLLDRTTKDIIGTYRIQPARHGLAHNGIYSAREYDLSGIEHLFDRAIECGRACVAKPYRKATSLLALWSAIHVYLGMSGARHLFGCCSVPSHDPDDGWRVMKTLRAAGYLHPEILLPPTPDYSCGSPDREFDPSLGGPLPLPKLFGAYMRLGSLAVSQPAIDREFGTIDFLILTDVRNLNMSDFVIKQ